MEKELNLIKAPKRYDSKKIRVKLWNKDPHCCYCEQLTVLPADCIQVKHGKPQPNMATLEHVYTKFEKDRYENDNHRLLALACYKCNNLMGAIRCALVPLEELQRRSQLHKEKKEKKKLFKEKAEQTKPLKEKSVSSKEPDMNKNIIEFILDVVVMIGMPIIPITLTIQLYLLFNIDKINQNEIFGLSFCIVVSCLFLYNSCLAFQNIKNKIINNL